MTISKNILAGSGAVDSGYKIDQSLLLDDTGNAHLKRTPSSAGNRRTFTLSCWIKRPTEGAPSTIFAQDLSFQFESGSDERALKIGYYTGAGGHVIRLATTAVFRDISAWYHIVLAVDTTQSTASNRIKMYVNGVQQTSFQSGQSTYPSQNLELPVNNTTDVFYLGALNATAHSIGYLADTHFIDGTALAPSSFGETNDDTGQWIPKEYTGGSYGTNGFYLPFKTGDLYSADFDGTGDYLSQTSMTTIGSGDFTIEGWCNRRDAGNQGIFQYSNAALNGKSGALGLGVYSNNFYLYYGTSGALAGRQVYVTIPAVGEWWHFAYVRASGTITIYLNGTAVTTQSTTVDFNDTTLTVGGYYSTNYLWNGLMSNFRVVKGTAVYTSNFTPPTSALTSVSGTILLNCQNSNIQTSTTGSNMTAQGNAVASNTSPTDFNDTFSADKSGQGNTLTAVNLANSDVVADSPTNNFATWNPANRTPYYVFAEGNLKLTVPGQWRNAIATMGVSTGKWYWEQIVSASSTKYCNPGFVTDRGFADNSAGTYLGYKAWSWGYDGSNGKIWHNAAGTTQLTVAPTTQWKAGVALDLDNGKAWFSLNGVWMGTGANPSTGAGAAFPSLTTGINYYPATTLYNLNSTANFGQNGTFSGLATAQGNADTNGIGNFFYPVPTGFKALCTNNLPESAVTPSEHFNTLLYNGSGNTTNNVTGVGFQPDFVWIKRGNVNASHALFDAVRGPNKVLNSNTTNAQGTDSGAGFSAFGSDGFTVYEQQSAAGVINSGNMISWNWKAGGTAPVKTYTVKVVSDSGNKYRFDDFAASAQTVDMQEGGAYTFDQSDSSNSGHPFRFSTTSNGTHASGSEYTTGVVTSGTPGSAGAKTVLTIAAGAPTLYYYCSVHSGMGGQANTNSTFGSTNFEGNRTSIVSANVDAGFSIGTHGHNTGSPEGTFGHGLGVAPDVIIEKKLDVSGGDGFVMTSIPDGSPDYLRLNTAAINADGWSSLNLPTSTVYNTSVGAGGGATSVVAYAFAQKPGYSKFGIYYGNGNVDGAFVYTGFKPAYILIKRTTAGTDIDWYQSDSASNPTNDGNTLMTWANHNYTQQTSTGYAIDYLSNGFKLRNASGYLNASNAPAFYMAFAESPFKYANAI